MWNAVILPILTSLTATGLGILLVWIFNIKKREDKISNEFERISNKFAGITDEITAVKAQMEIGFNRENLEKDTLLNAFNSAKTEMEQTIEASALRQREFYQDIIERIHVETLAREAFSRTVKTSIDVIEQTVADNSESITKLERQVETLTSEIENLKQPRIINP